MALKISSLLLLALSALIMVGCGDKPIPADPSVSKIGTEDPSDPKDSGRMKKGSIMPGAPPGVGKGK